MLDTARLRPSLWGVSARVALNACDDAGRATPVRVVDRCVIPHGMRAIVCAGSPLLVRAFVRRFVACAGNRFSSETARWRSAAFIAQIPASNLGAWRAFLARCRCAFPRNDGDEMHLTQSREHMPSAQPPEAQGPPRKRPRVASVRKRAGLVRVIDRILDTRFGADESAARVRRYVAEHDAPSSEGVAFGRLCEVIFAQGIGNTVVESKRDALAAGFAGYDPVRVAAFGDAEVSELLRRPIIRNEAKIRACVVNAARWRDVARDESGYLARVARVAAADEPMEGWPALVDTLRADFARINEMAARQTLKRWGFFTAFAHPGARRVAERLGIVESGAPSEVLQLEIGALAQALSRDPYAVEGALALFAALGPCRPEPQCEQCGLADRCPTSKVGAAC
jgi:3-methyladenine DNA glycosylase Tag